MACFFARLETTPPGTPSGAVLVASALVRTATPLGSMASPVVLGTLGLAVTSASSTPLQPRSGSHPALSHCCFLLPSVLCRLPRGHPRRRRRWRASWAAGGGPVPAAGARGAPPPAAGGDNDGCVYCASHKNWTSVHQLPFQNHCFIGSGGGSWCWSGCCGSSFC